MCWGTAGKLFLFLMALKDVTLCCGLCPVCRPPRPSGCPSRAQTRSGECTKSELEVPAASVSAEPHVLASPRVGGVREASGVSFTNDTHPFFGGTALTTP